MAEWEGEGEGMNGSEGDGWRGRLRLDREWKEGIEEDGLSKKVKTNL